MVVLENLINLYLIKSYKGAYMIFNSPCYNSESTPMS